MPDTLALRRRIQELQDQVASLTTERDLAVIDRTVAVSELAHAYQLTCDPADIPAELVHALRSAGDQHQRVRLTVDGADLHALVDGAGYDADPGAEARVWAWLTAAEPTGHAFARADMPDRLHGVAWPDGTTTISAALTGRDVTAAHRALRPRRPCGLARALGMLLIPGAAAGRAALGLAREAHTAASATAAAAAGSALPAVTAAAISCTAVTSCAPIYQELRPSSPSVSVADAVPAAAVDEPPKPRAATDRAGEPAGEAERGKMPPDPPPATGPAPLPGDAAAAPPPEPEQPSPPPVDTSDQPAPASDPGTGAPTPAGPEPVAPVEPVIPEPDNEHPEPDAEDPADDESPLNPPQSPEDVPPPSTTDPALIAELELGDATPPTEPLLDLLPRPEP